MICQDRLVFMNPFGLTDYNPALMPHKEAHGALSLLIKTRILHPGSAGMSKHQRDCCKEGHSHEVVRKVGSVKMPLQRHAQWAVSLHCPTAWSLWSSMVELTAHLARAAILGPLASDGISKAVLNACVSELSQGR